MNAQCTSANQIKISLYHISKSNTYSIHCYNSEDLFICFNKTYLCSINDNITCNVTDFHMQGLFSIPFRSLIYFRQRYEMLYFNVVIEIAIFKVWGNLYKYHSFPRALHFVIPINTKWFELYSFSLLRLFW